MCVYLCGGGRRGCAGHRTRKMAVGVEEETKEGEIEGLTEHVIK